MVKATVAKKQAYELTRVDKAKCAQLRKAISAFMNTNVAERKAITHLLFARTNNHEFGTVMLDCRSALDMLIAGRFDEFAKWEESRHGR